MAESGMDLKAYAEQAGKVRKTLSDKVLAWRVLAVTDIGHEAVRDSWSQLSEIHAAPQWFWIALFHAMVENGWTVAATRERVIRSICLPDSAALLLCWRSLVGWRWRGR